MYSERFYSLHKTKEKLKKRKKEKTKKEIQFKNITFSRPEFISGLVTHEILLLFLLCIPIAVILCVHSLCHLSYSFITMINSCINLKASIILFTL